jgi:hypothetical protein
MTDNERNAMLDECFEHNEPLSRQRTSCCRITSSASGTAMTLYWKNGKVATTDGPNANHSYASRMLREDTGIIVVDTLISALKQPDAPSGSL